MAKRRTKTEPEIDETLRSVLTSPEYAAAIKERALAGKISPTEAALLRSIGATVPIIDRDTVARENLSKMDRTTCRLLSDLDRLAMSENSPSLRVYESADLIGVVGPASLLAASLKADRMGSVPSTVGGTPYTGPLTAVDEAYVDRLVPPDTTDEELLP